MRALDIMKKPFQMYWGLVKQIQATQHFKSSQKDLNKVLVSMYSDIGGTCTWEFDNEKDKWKLTIPHSTENRVVYAYTGERGIWQANKETGEKVDVYEIYKRKKRKEDCSEFAWELLVDKQ